MALTYSQYAGHNKIHDSVQIARNGNIKIYYIDSPMDILKEHDPDDAMDIISNLVDEATNDLQFMNIGTKKLMDLDSDILTNSCPVNRQQRRIFHEVKNKLAVGENKFYHCPDGTLLVVPPIQDGQRNAVYISGPSGVGKSSWCSQYARQYQIENPGNRIFLFSRKTYDPAFDGVIDGLIRVPLDRKFITDTQQVPGSDIDPLASYNNSLIIFDDFESIADPIIKKAVLLFKDAVFTLGRQHKIDICSIQHKSLGGAKSMVDLCESNVLVCFPRKSLGECMRMLSRYCHYSKYQLEQIFDDKSKLERWMCIIRPNFIITQHYIKVID